MGSKLNCWEFRNCGLESGGVLSRVYGECTVPKVMKNDGVNGGVGAGRTCWSVVNSCNSGCRPAGRKRRKSCLECEFHLRVISEENLLPQILDDEIFVTPKIHI